MGTLVRVLNLQIDDHPQDDFITTIADALQHIRIPTQVLRVERGEAGRLMPSTGRIVEGSLGFDF
jgi:hypothetical protein